MQCLALFVVALLPIEFLAIRAAVEALFASGAPFVFDRLTFRGTAMAAQSKDSCSAFVFFGVRDIFFQLALLLKPWHGRVVDPGVEELDV